MASEVPACKFEVLNSVVTVTPQDCDMHKVLSGTKAVMQNANLADPAITATMSDLKRACWSPAYWHPPPAWKGLLASLERWVPDRLKNLAEVAELDKTQDVSGWLQNQGFYRLSVNRQQHGGRGREMQLRCHLAACIGTSICSVLCPTPTTPHSVQQQQVSHWLSGLAPIRAHE